MELEKQILDHLKQTHEYLIVDGNGTVVQSSHTLFKEKDLSGTQLSDDAPFLYNYISSALANGDHSDIELDCVTSEMFNAEGIYDIKLSSVENGSQMILIDIEDRTKHYNKLQDAHQQKTELMLNKDAIVRQTDIIKHQNEEIKTLIKEAHHRIKNNLQVVSSLIQFQAREVKDLKIKDMFNDLQSRVHSIAAIHEKLYRSSNLKDVNIHEYINLLVHELIDNYSVDKKIDVNVQIDTFNISVKTLVPLGLLINELVANSLKHGFKDRDSGHIDIRLERLEGNRCRLTVSDDGAGIPKNFLTSTNDSIGSELIQIFTNQLWGNVTILDEPGGVVQIDFNLIDNIT